MIGAVTIFDFTNYKTFLTEAIGRSEKNGRGMKSRLAQALNCQSAFVSQVLNADLHFSLEHAPPIAKFFGMNGNETQFLLLLIQYARAGTEDLKKLLEGQIREARNRHHTLRERFKIQKSLKLEDELYYYSDWSISAVHVMTSIPQFENANSISKALQLPLVKVDEVLKFLVKCGLVKSENGRHVIGKTRIHLGSDSPLITKHHTNWRLRSMRSLENPQEQDLRYTSVVSLSSKDASFIRSLLIQTLEKYNQIVADSPEEECFYLCLDFVPLAGARAADGFQ